LEIERRHTRLEGDAAAVEAYFEKMKVDNDTFFSSIQRDSEGRLMNVFWQTHEVMQPLRTLVMLSHLTQLT